MKKIISFFVIVVCLLFAIQLTSCGDKTDSPEVPVVPENPDKPDNPDTPESPDIPEDSVIISNLATPGDDKYYDSYKQTIDELGKLIESGAVSSNEQLIEAAKKYDNIIHTFEKDSILYLYFEGGWTYMADFEGRTAVKGADEDFDFSQFDDLIAELKEFQNFENNPSSAKSQSRASHNTRFLAPEINILFWGPYEGSNENSKHVANLFKTACNLFTTRELNYKSLCGSECSINDFKNFGDYDIVIIYTHGAPGGIPTVPNTIKGIESVPYKFIEGNTADGTLLKYLSYEFLNDYLPDLSKTVVWTVMCNSFPKSKSVFATVAKQKSAGDFFGATESIDAETNLRFFCPFIVWLYAGASSYDAFSLEGKKWLPYEIKKYKEKVKGEVGHKGFDGVCYPMTNVAPAVDNKPSAFWQAPTGEIDKVAKGTGHFKAGIEVKNTKTSKTTKIELKEDNIESTQKKPFNQIIERYDYTFKTEGLEAGKYEYRSYIEFTNGDIKYSDDTETFEIEDGDYFELQYDGNGHVNIDFNKEVEILRILCDDEPISEFWVRYSKLHWSFNRKSGFHHYKIFYSGQLDEIKLSPLDLCGGNFPTPISIKPWRGENKISEISASKAGDYILTVPHLKYISCDKNFAASIKSINLNGCEDLIEINASSFVGAKSLKNLDLSNCTNLSYIGGFSECPLLTTVNVSNCPNLTYMHDYTFKNCPLLSTVNFSNCQSLSNIGRYAFDYCTSLISINFSGCQNLSIIDGAFCVCSSLNSIDFHGCTNLIIIKGFNKCESLKSIDFSVFTNLTTIDGSFYDCSSLNSVNFRGCSKLTSIENGSFSYCSSLTAVSINPGSSSVFIGNKVFSYCSNLSKVALQENISLHFDKCFYFSPVKTVYSYSLVPPCNTNPFPKKLTDYAKIYVPASSVEIYKEKWGVWDYSEGYNHKKCVNIFPM